ncbi:MAG: hypothetical protein WC675_05520 [Patescibacteria group bacterium]|jgi:SAM-dependent methyltransferase
MLEVISYIIVFIVAGATLVTGLLVGASIIALAFTKVPFVPTPKKNVKIVIDQFELKPGQIFYDLGCGDGQFLIEAESRGAKTIGFEVSPWAYAKGRFNLWRHKSQAKIIFKNFYDQNISEADAVFCFLIDTVMPKVEEKLKRELKLGAKIISYGFTMPSWPPVKIVEIKKGNKRASKIYLYQKY